MNVILKDDSAAYKRWQKTPNPLNMKFYMLNLTNPEEVRQGGQPILKEVGPYVYDEYRERVNIEKHEDGTISFQKKTSLFFNQEKSGDARQDDVVTIINVVLLAGYLERRELTPPPLPVTHWLDQHWGLCLPPIRDGNRSYSLPLPERDLAISTFPCVWEWDYVHCARESRSPTPRAYERRHP
uniref:Uncharacterized protein n=1 Tax=Timema poppense TaxID=170557 RepID=A0A7R9HE56_TIMPO|nr:unnamed protein product [Timema poppensis]